MIYLVTIQDKETRGEPDIGVAIVDVADEASALATADATLDQLRERGMCRCVPHAKPIELGKFYRVSMLVKPPNLT